MADEEKKETAKKTAPKKAAAPRRTARTTRAKAAEVKAEEPKTTAADKEITETKHIEAEKPAIHKEEKIMTQWLRQEDLQQLSRQLTRCAKQLTLH